MPTKHPRIPVTRDHALAEAMARVEPYFRGQTSARVVHDLAIRGAEAVAHDHARRAAAIERLVTLSAGHGAAIDWQVLEEIDRRAWVG